MKQYRKVEEVSAQLSPMQLATLADVYDNGDGALSEEDSEKSIMYCKMAAEMGDAYAQSTLANAYTIGRDVEKNDELALYWYKKAAEQGYPYAQYELGKRLSDEEGGLLWLHASAKQGLWLSMKELSDRLSETDPKAARKWLKCYNRNKDKRGAWRWHGKKYMREYRRTVLPKVIDGEVVIKI